MTLPFKALATLSRAADCAACRLWTADATTSAQLGDRSYGLRHERAHAVEVPGDLDLSAGGQTLITGGRSAIGLAHGIVQGMSFNPLPATAAWLHREARSGFEVVYFGDTKDGYRVEGRSAAIEGGHTWVVDYEISLNYQWVTRSATINSRTAPGIHSSVLEADGHGRWKVDSKAAPQLDGCLDVDLEASAFTNALPVRRLQLEVGDRASAPAAYVRVLTSSVERLEQTYVHTEDTGPELHFEYTAPIFGFSCELIYDESGLLMAYPGIATRAG